MGYVVRRFVPFLAVLASLLAAAPAHAAAPNYILVSGPGISHPILLGNWDENLALLGALVDARIAKGSAVRHLARRPRFDLAEFWGWSGLPRPTRPSQANQHGWLYPAHGAKPAVIVLMVDGARVPRLLPTRVREIFARHGVPLRL
jgi:hypothetical protein